MNITLRVLIILILMLNGVSLWFATVLYGKRELLIDRNRTLEDSIVQLAKTFEAEDAPYADTSANHEARDISEVSLANADITPDTSDFWTTYQEQYEKQDGKRYDISNKRDDLAEIYELDGEGKPLLDSRGQKITEGAPMAKLLEEVQDKAVKQYGRMNLIRSELAKVRAELEDTITELNKVKKAGRADKKTIKAREDTIAELESKVSQLEDEKASLEAQIAALEEEKTALQADLEKVMEEKEQMQADIDKLRNTLEELTRGQSTGKVAINITAGVKGTITKVDNEYNIAIFKATPETMTELLGEDRQERTLPDISFLVKRPGAKASAVAGKIQLRTLVASGDLIVCDILKDWKQTKIEAGDEVFYLD